MPRLRSSLCALSFVLAGLACDRGGDPQPIAQKTKAVTPPATPPAEVKPEAPAEVKPDAPAEVKPEAPAGVFVAPTEAARVNIQQFAPWPAASTSQGLRFL